MFFVIKEVTISSACLLIYIFFSGLYLFPSGNPQVSDFILFIGISIIFLSGIPKNKTNSKIFLLISYVFIVNLFWSAYHADLTPVKYSLFYIYNSLVFIFVTYLFNKNKVSFELMYLALFLSLCFEVILTIIIPSGAVRAVGGFENPNQLAYFSLLIMTSMCLLFNHVRSGLLLISVSFSLVTYLILISLSKAGIISLILLLAIFYIRSIKYLFIAIFFGFLFFYSYDDQIYSAIERISGIGTDADDSAAHRGYDRIINNPELLFFGAGEGVYTHFESIWGGELHSTLGTLLFSYGIFGFSLFVYFLIFLKKANKYEIFLTLPIVAYGLTHNGLRSTLLWVFLAILYSSINLRK